MTAQQAFPHIITASNVQETARIIQAEFKKSEGHKLKRSSILNALSSALKYANKKIMESDSGTITIHKDIPLYVGASNFQLEGDTYSSFEPKFYFGTSEEDVTNQIECGLIDDLWDDVSHSLTSIVIIEIEENSSLSEIFKKNAAEILSAIPEDIQNLHPQCWDNESLSLIGDQLSSFPEFKTIIAETMMSNSLIEGSCSTECITEGIDSPETYLPSMKNNHGYIELEGLFEVNLEDMHKDQNIFSLLNSTIFEDETEMQNALFGIVHDHGRSTKSPSSIFIYATSSIEILSTSQESIDYMVDKWMCNAV